MYSRHPYARGPCVSAEMYLLLKALERDVESVCYDAGEPEVCGRILSVLRAYMRRVEDRSISDFLRSYFRST
jgi:hypothetical protein